MAKFRKTGNVADIHKGRPQKINTPSPTRKCYFENTSLEDPPWWRWALSLQNPDLAEANWSKKKAGGETFWKDIRQRIENNPGLLDLSDLNDVDHCGFCMTSATLPVSRNLVIKRWIFLLLGTLFLPKSLLQFCCVRKTDFVAKYVSIIFVRCCVVNCPVESILVSKESPRPVGYIS